MRRIAALGLTGWALVVGLGWWLAHTRISVCAGSGASKARCRIDAIAARDDVLIHGLTVALLVGVGLLTAGFIITRSRRGSEMRQLEEQRSSVWPALRGRLSSAYNALRRSPPWETVPLAVAAILIAVSGAIYWYSSRSAPEVAPPVIAAEPFAHLIPSDAAAPHAAVESPNPYADLAVDEEEETPPSEADESEYLSIEEAVDGE